MLFPLIWYFCSFLLLRWWCWGILGWSYLGKELTLGKWTYIYCCLTSGHFNNISRRLFTYRFVNVDIFLLNWTLPLDLSGRFTSFIISSTMQWAGLELAPKYHPCSSTKSGGMSFGWRSHGFVPWRPIHPSQIILIVICPRYLFARKCDAYLWTVHDRGWIGTE